MTDRTSPETENLSAAIMGAARLYTHDHQTAWKITQAALATIAEQRTGVAQCLDLGESESELREENLRSLLREARQYVYDDFLNDDMEVNKHSQSLLKDIDAALGSPATSTDRSSIMQAADKAAKVVEGWSDAKQEYAKRVTGPESSPDRTTGEA